MTYILTVLMSYDCKMLGPISFTRSSGQKRGEDVFTAYITRTRHLPETVPCTAHRPLSSQLMLTTSPSHRHGNENPAVATQGTAASESWLSITGYVVGGRPVPHPTPIFLFTQMHPHADTSHSLFTPELTMSPNPESRLKFDHSSQGLLLRQISPLGCFVRQLISLS